MKISMKTLASGPTGVLRPGFVYDLPEEEANQLVAGRYAVEVEDPAPATGPDAAKVVAPVEESKIEKDGDEDDEPSRVDHEDPDSVLASMKAKVEGSTSTDSASDPYPENPAP
jgi:hypothetical protein